MARDPFTKLVREIPSRPEDRLAEYRRFRIEDTSSFDPMPGFGTRPNTRKGTLDA